MYRCILGVLLFTIALNTQAQSLFWRTDWSTTGVQQSRLISDNEAIRTTTGKLVVVTDLPIGGYQVTSMTASGASNWQINVGDYSDGAAALIAGTDDSVFLGIDGSTAKLDSSGHIVWTRIDGVDHQLALSNGILLRGACGGVTAVNADTGVTQWFTAIPSSTSCQSSIGTDTTGNVYAALRDGGSYSAPLELMSFDASGSLRWVISSAVADAGVKFLGVVDGKVYVQQGRDTGAYDAATGASIWTRTGVEGVLLAGSPATPIAVDDTLHKLDEADGHDDWNQTLASGPIESSAVDGDNIYFCNTASVAKISAATGNVAWSFGLSNAECFAVIDDAANVYAATFDDSTGSIRIDTIDAATGAQFNSSLAGNTIQGVEPWDTWVSAGQIVQSGQVPTYATNLNRLRLLNAATGAVDWDIAFDTPYYYGGPPGFAYGPYLAVSSDSIVATVFSNYYAGGYWVGLFARADGSPKWSYFAHQDGQTSAWGSAPLIDAHGDVFVSYYGDVPCSPTTGICSVNDLLKLSGADGSLLWHFDDVGIYDWGAAFVLLGDNLLVGGGFGGPFAGTDVALLSGVDGSVIWSASPFGGDGSTYAINVNPDGTITVNGSSRALLTNKGQVLWTDHVMPPCQSQNYCFFYDPLQLPDGTVVDVGREVGYGLVTVQALTQNAPVRMTVVGGDAPADVTTQMVQAFEDTDGVTWLRGSMYQQSGYEIEFMAQFDPQTLALSNQQVLTTLSPDPYASTLGLSMLSAPAGNLLPAVTYVSGGDAPNTSGAAVLNTAVTAHGDLALDITANRQANASTLQVTITYDGDTAVANAHLLLWRGGPYDAGSLACITQNASNCVITNHLGYAEATFDIQPGGNVTVSGVYPADTTSSVLYAAVTGPTSLAEPTLGNNFRSAPVEDVIFRNGFD